MWYAGKVLFRNMQQKEVNQEKSEESSEEGESEIGKKDLEKKRNEEIDRMRLGEQLQDDVINSFCDKIQAVCPKKLEGLLAIQFLSCDPESVPKHISGKHEVVQILYDKTRLHYILTHYKPSIHQVIIYDSLQGWDSDQLPTFPDELYKDIQQLYSHLFKGNICMAFDRKYERQQDDFSCGYRSIGAVIDIARDESPIGKTYSRSAIFYFLQKILKEPKPQWETFRDVRIHHSRRQSTTDTSIVMYLPNIRCSQTSSEDERTRSSCGSESENSLHTRLSSAASFDNDSDDDSQVEENPRESSFQKLENEKSTDDEEAICGLLTIKRVFQRKREKTREDLASLEEGENN